MFKSIRVNTDKLARKACRLRPLSRLKRTRWKHPLRRNPGNSKFQVWPIQNQALENLTMYHTTTTSWNYQNGWMVGWIFVFSNKVISNDTELWLTTEKTWRRTWPDDFVIEMETVYHRRMLTPFVRLTKSVNTELNFSKDQHHACQAA